MTRDLHSLGALDNKVVQVGSYKFTGKVLGKGSFAVVKEAIHAQLKVHVSVKTIDLRKCNNYMLKNYLREAMILQNLNHPFIMRIFETMKHNNMYYMVTEIAQGGDLCSYVQQKKGKIDENTTRRFSRQIASALKYLHGKGIVHRDLKLENVMLDPTKRNIKLIDFGLTNNWSLDSPLKTLCGSPEYSAPELFVPGTVYGPEVDIWALGVIMYAMAAGRLPFPCISVIMKIPEKKSQFLRAINRGLSDDQTKLISGYSPEFKHLIKGLMNPNWEKRMTINDVFRDVWMTNRDHWIDVPYESLDSYDLEKIIRQLSFKVKMSPEKLKAELKKRPCGEVGGLFNIMVYQEMSDKHNVKLDIKPQSETSSQSVSMNTPTKKRPSKQSFEGPIKMSLTGNAMKLNEVNFTSRLKPVCIGVSTPTSATASDSSGKKTDSRGKQPLLSKLINLKSNCSSPPFSKLKNQPKISNKGIQVSTLSNKRRSIPGKTIFPSSLTPTQSWEQERPWQRNLFKI